jgi:hypothetical protein
MSVRIRHSEYCRNKAFEIKKQFIASQQKVYGTM